MNNPNLVIVCLAILLYSCTGQHTDKKNTQFFDGHGTTNMSTDTAVLANLIKLTTFKPTHVEFKYSSINNSENKLTVPAPSDVYLNAVMYFDDTTFNKLKAKCNSIQYASPGYIPLDFYFSWLSSDIQKELLKCDTNYHGHPDYYFSRGTPGKLWLLNNKVLLIEDSN